MINALTGRNRYLYDSLLKELEDAQEVKIIVSFLRESGAQLLARDLKKQALKGANIKILTSRYLNITEPSALYLLKDFLGNWQGHSFELKFYEDDGELSFHPKAYFFSKSDGKVLFVGSSNISYSALHSGIEWNYRLEEKSDPEAFREFERDFDDLFNNYSISITDKVLKKYADHWKKPEIIKKIDASEISIVEKQLQEAEKPQPRGAQIEALYELKLAREEGISEGIVAAATGVGKTYLAAFDTEDYNKILFVAHREEILKQAEESFLNIYPELKTSFFNGTEKDESGDIVFASIQTLHKDKYLKEYFEKEEFDYIVVDEFHHAAADSYLSILEYFEPQFFLGLTATPYRMDNKDIFALCNNNLIYEINLRSAINRGLLVPFKYYGIYDPEVDYDKINFNNGKYNKKELEEALSSHKRADLIYKNYLRLSGKRTLGFCASIEHSRYMAEYFNEKGINAVCVHSSSDKGPYFMERDKVVKKLSQGKIDVIFAVDIFNEGVDIPALDTVLFLRPTESYVVFLQQLGRGLRKFENKGYLKVLDFIGNYKRAHYLPYLLAGENPMQEGKRRSRSLEDFDFPEGCDINIDLQLISLFEKMKKNDPLEVRMKDEYFRLKDELGRRPMRVDLYQGTDIEMKNYLNSRYYEKGFLRFLHDIGELNSTEKEWFNTIAEELLLYLESTRMSKLYKIPVLSSFIQDDQLQMKVSLEEIGQSFMNFYKDNKKYQKDLNNKKHKNWQEWELERFIKEAEQNPVHFLNKKKYFIHDEVNNNFLLNPELEQFLSKELTSHFQDIIEFRKLRYYNRRLKDRLKG